jgi:hypothetical protein
MKILDMIQIFIPLCVFRRFMFGFMGINGNTLRLPGVLNPTEREVRQDNVEGHKTRNKKDSRSLKSQKDASDPVAHE